MLTNVCLLAAILAGWQIMFTKYEFCYQCNLLLGMFLKNYIQHQTNVSSVCRKYLFYRVVTWTRMWWSKFTTVKSFQAWTVWNYIINSWLDVNLLQCCRFLRRKLSILGQESSCALAWVVISPPHTRLLSPDHLAVDLLYEA